MITAAALIALGYFKVDYSSWLFVVTVIQDLVICSYFDGVRK